MPRRETKRAIPTGAEGVFDADLARALFAGSDVAALITGPDDAVLALNAAAESELECAAADAVGRPLVEVYPARVARRFRAEADSPAWDRATLERGGETRELLQRVVPLGDDGRRLIQFRAPRDDAWTAQENRRLRSMFEQGLIAGLMAPDGTLLEANRAFLAASGTTSADVLGRPFLEVGWWAAAPAAADLARRGFREALGGRTARLEVAYRAPDGDDAHLDVTLLPIKSPDGAVRYVMQKALDATERKREEARAADLRATLEGDTRFRRLADLAPVMIWVADRHGSRSFLSRSWYEFTGQTPETGLGLGWMDAIHPEDRAMVELAFRRSALAEEAFRVEYRLLRSDGAYRWALDSAATYRDSEGRFVGFLGSVIDVSERIAAERVMRASEERFRTLANSIPQLAWMARPDGSIFWFNQRWYDYTGMTLEDAQGFGWTRAHDPAELPRVLEKYRRTFAAGEPWEDIFPLRRHDGDMRWHLSRALPIRDDSGAIELWLGTNTDITDQRELEQALRENDRRKDEFLALLAHELRNPLAPIKNSLEIVRLAQDDPAAVAAAHAVIERQLFHMVRLVDDLLDLSRINRGIIQLRTECLDLGEIVRAAVETSLPLIDECEHELVLSLPDEPVRVRGDATRLAQVFSNLLNNAAKYTPPRGRIEIRVQSEGQRVEAIVQDSGVGIPKDMLERVFDMFAQVDTSIDKAQGGLGIGLTLVRRLVEMHDGSVRAESDEPGGGSRFVVSLPKAAPEEPAAAPEGRAEAGDAKGRRILVVDDNVDSTMSMALMLRYLGNETATAHDGFEALEVAQTFLPDVVLLDLGMPRLDGYETARRMRAEPWGKDVLLVALTGWGQERERKKTEEAGFDHHLVKPVEIELLKTVLGRGRAKEG